MDEILSFHVQDNLKQRKNNEFMNDKIIKEIKRIEGWNG